MSTPIASYWHALNLISPGNAFKLWEKAKFLGGPDQMWRTTAEVLIELGLQPNLAQAIHSRKSSININDEWDKLAQFDIRTLIKDEPGYPKLLAQIHSAPPIIYTRGNQTLLDQPGLAFVGSRHMTSYGKEAVRLLVPQVCTYNQNIVSGMAFGIDAAALECCLDCQGTPIAVLASGLTDSEISPRENLGLAKRIIDHGCLVSEYPPGLITFKGRFPQRNRIVSGLSQGVVVVEAALNSGSLITAKLALEQNREVFAVPGSVFSATSHGTLTLIKQGAICTTSIQDIAQELGWKKNALPLRQLSKNSFQQNLTPAQKEQILILKALGRQSANLDQIIAQTKLTAAQVLAHLTELELTGSLRRTSNGVYHKAR